MLTITERNTIKDHDISYKSLQNLLEHNSFRTEKKCSYTNIINQDIGTSYALPCFNGDIINDFMINYKNNINLIKDSDCIAKFFEYNEFCRIKKIPLYYCEKQIFLINKKNLINAYEDVSINKSCIEYDFDIYLKEKCDFDESFYEYILSCMCGIL